MEIKVCKNCKYHSLDHPNDTTGMCRAPLPEWVRNYCSLRPLEPTYRDSGTNCISFVPKVKHPIKKEKEPKQKGNEMKVKVFELSIRRERGKTILHIKADPRIEALFSENAPKNTSSVLSETLTNFLRIEKPETPETPVSYWGKDASTFHAEVKASLQRILDRQINSSIPEKIIGDAMFNYWPLRLVGISSESGIGCVLPSGHLYTEEELVEYAGLLKTAAEFLFRNYIKDTHIYAELHTFTRKTAKKE